MTSIIPSPWTIVHIPRAMSATRDDDTGNYEFIDGTPVKRQVQSIAQFGRFSSHEVFGPDVTERIETKLRMACDDPTIYNPSDLIILNGEFDANGNYIPNTGEAYFVDGEPGDQRQGPWPDLLAVFGGVVKIRRVT